jgi:hypothetical protein
MSGRGSTKPCTRRSSTSGSCDTANPWCIAGSFRGSGRRRREAARNAVRARRPLDLHFRQVPKDSPLLADKVPDLRCLCMGGDGRNSHLACCTTAAAQAESPPPAGRGSDGLDGDRQAGAQGLRGGERRERRSSDPGHLKGGALGGYGDYARPERSGPHEPRRPRRGSPVGDRGTADGLLERSRPDAYRGRPWRRARDMSAGTNTESFDGGRSHLSRRRPEREGCRSGVARRVWRGAAGTLRPLLVHGSAGRPNRGEPSGRGRGVPGNSLHVRSSSLDTRSPPESRPRPVARSPGVASPATLIVTASRIGLMPERRSCNLRGSCRSRSRCRRPRVMRTPKPCSVRGTRGSPGRGRGPSGRPGAQKRRVHSANQSANHSGPQSGAHS